MANMAIPEKLCKLIKEYADDYDCIELLQFFGAHPLAKFNRLAVTHALNSNGSRLHTERALKHLVNKGLIRIHIGNNVPLYSLTEDEALRSLVLRLTDFDWQQQWQLLLSQNMTN